MMLLFFVGVLAASAEMINVNWRMGMDREEQYIEANPGDSIKFSWYYGHNVYIMNTCNESQFKDFKCPQSGADSENLGSNSPVTYKISDDATGYLCFWCQVGQHCMFGQHMTVKLPSKPQGQPEGPSPITIDWKLGMEKAGQYLEVAKPGQKLIFKWSGAHNVMLMDECDGEGDQLWSDFQCPSDESESKNLGGNSPVTYTVPENAPKYLCFWCSYGFHCAAGQHSTVKVKFAEEAKQLPAMINVDWRMGMERKEQYIEANPGDSIKFSWQYGHNVYIMDTCNESQFKDFKCPSSKDGSKNLGGNSPVTYKISDDATGYLCFWCQIGQHCMFGQHMTVKLPSKEEEAKQLPAPINIQWMVGMGAMGKSITAKPGQELVFKFGQGHNVLLMKSCDGAGAQRWSDFTCPETEDDSINLGESGPVKYTIPKENPPAYLCFWCSVGGHCTWGQHSTVKVEGVGNGDKDGGEEKEQPKGGDDKKDKAGKQSKRSRRKADKAERKARRGRRRGERGGKRERKGRKERTRRRRRRN